MKKGNTRPSHESRYRQRTGPETKLTLVVSHPYIHFGVELLNMLFYFAGFVALSVFLGKLLFCRGSVCSAARADAVFAAFLWLSWSASTALLALEMFKGGLSKKGDSPKMAMKEAPGSA